jgi:hypothetical protein
MDFGHFKNVHFSIIEKSYKLKFLKKWVVTIMVLFLFLEKQVVIIKNFVKCFNGYFM